MLKKCPRCGHPWQSTMAMNQGPSEFWMECSNSKCNAYYNTYVPQAHQAAFHEDDHMFVGNFGGYGSGKTLTDREELYKHILITEKGNSLIGANVASQYEQTIKREIEGDWPVAFVKRINTQKQYVDMNNDHRVMYRPYDNPDKLRSYNLTSFLIVEGSEVKEQSFTQLKTRARNLAATSPRRDDEGNIIYRKAGNGVLIPEIEHNWIKGIIESNPSAGWIRDNVLFVSDTVNKHGEVLDEFSVDPVLADPHISTHITSTSANEFLPPNFIAQNTKNKPLWWVNRYIYGSFLYAEGLVYPAAVRCVVDDFDIPPSWKRMVAFDYGLSDDSVFVFAAIDEKEGIVYIYKEVRTNNKNVEELANLLKQAMRDIPLGGLYMPPIIDPKSATKRDYNKVTLEDHFLAYGLSFIPGDINIDARVFKTNTYFESGRLKVFRSCSALNREFVNYKFAQDESVTSGFTGKPVDKDNHGVNATEWICMKLPDNPSHLVYGVYNQYGKDISVYDEARLREKSYTDLLFFDQSENRSGVNGPYNLAPEYDYDSSGGGFSAGDFRNSF